MRMTKMLRPKFPALPPGRQIRQWRISEYLTQAGCADLLGISAVQLSRIERGKIAISPFVMARFTSLRAKAGPPKSAGDEIEYYPVHTLPSGACSSLSQ